MIQVILIVLAAFMGVGAVSFLILIALPGISHTDEQPELYCVLLDGRCPYSENYPGCPDCQVARDYFKKEGFGAQLQEDDNDKEI